MSNRVTKQAGGGPVSSADTQLRLEFAFAQLYKFKEFLYTGDNLTQINIWTDSSKTTKLYQKVFAYSGSDLASITVTRISDSFTYTKTFDYTAGNLTSITTA